MAAKLQEQYVIDVHGTIGRSKPLHQMLMDEGSNHELGQNSYFYISASENEEIYQELAKVTEISQENLPKEILILYGW